MALLTAQVIVRTGLVVSPSAANAGGDTFQNNGKRHLEVANASGSSVTVTVASEAAISQGQAQLDSTTIVADGTTAKIGPFAPSAYNNSSGIAAITYSSATSVTVALVEQ